MGTMTISLNDVLKEHISSKGTTAGAYIRMLILQDMIDPIPEGKRKKLEMASMYLSKNGFDKTKELFSELFEDVESPVQVAPKPAIIPIERKEESIPPVVKSSPEKKKRPIIPSIQ